MHRKIPAVTYRDGKSIAGEAFPPVEEKFDLFLNGVRLVTIPASPDLLRELAVGFLYSSGLVQSAVDIEEVRVGGGRIEIEMKHPPVMSREQLKELDREAGTGCGGGAMFMAPGSETGLKRIEGSYRVLRQELISGGKKVAKRNGTSTHEGRGLHFAILEHAGETVSSARDIARHNTVDKIIGDCLLRRIALSDKTLFITGRVSSEMVIKAARAGIPVVASLHTPTDLGVEKADRYGITVVGHLRGGFFSVFSHPERIWGN